MKINVEEIKKRLKEKSEGNHTLFPIGFIQIEDILKNLSSLFYEFKDSTTTIEYTVGDTKVKTNKSISPLFYNKVIEADENKKFIEIITSFIPYYYIEPSDVIEESGETILQDTRDLGINDVPAALQNNEFYETWFRDTWGYIQNNLLLDIYNKLEYPFITENQYINSTLFPSIADKIFNKSSKDEDSYIGFMNTDEENDIVYDKNYPFYGEEVGCLDYLDDIVNQKILSNYKIIDYTDKQTVLLQKWGESLYESGQLTAEELDTSKTVFKLQDIKNELMRRKFSGSRSVYQLAIASIDRQGSFITTAKVCDIEDSEDTSFNDKRVVRILNIPGILTEYYSFSQNLGIDILNAYFEKDGSIPLNTLVPLFYTSADQYSQIGTDEGDKSMQFDNEAFYSGKSINPMDIRIYQMPEFVGGLDEYRDSFLRDNTNTINWNSLPGIVSDRSAGKFYETLDYIELPRERTDSYTWLNPETGKYEIISEIVKNYRTLDSIYKDGKPFRLDINNTKVNTSIITGSISDISTGKILFNRNNLQEELLGSYPYVTSAIASGNSISLMDIPWINYVKTEITEKSKVQDNTEVGVQLNTISNLGKGYTSYNFFGISYTNDNSISINISKEEDNKNIKLEKYDGQKYALLWYCTIKYGNNFAVEQVERKLISKITLRVDEKGINRKFKDFDGENYKIRDEYSKYVKYNIGILPMIYPIIYQSNSDYKNIIWSTDIGFSNKLTSFVKDEIYFKKEGNTFVELTASEIQKGPDINTIYYNKYDEEYQEAQEFSDDTSIIGYSEAMFMFSDLDIISNSQDRNLSLDDNIGLFKDTSFNPSLDTKTVFYIIKKAKNVQYRQSNLLGENNYWVYNSDGTASIYSNIEDNWCWSNPIRVVSLTDELLNIEVFEPDWNGLSLFINPYLNFTTNSCSPLRKKKALGGYSFNQLGEQARKEGWPDASVEDLKKNILLGPCKYTALSNLTRIRSLDFLSNDNGEFPTEWVKDYEDDHPAKEIYGLYMERFRPALGEVVSTDSNAEYSSIFGDNRAQDAFDSLYSRTERFTNIDSYDLPSYTEGKVNVLYIISYTSEWKIVEERNTSKYFIWSKTDESPSGKFEEINPSEKISSRSDIYSDNITNLYSLSISPNLGEKAGIKWYKNYFKVMPCISSRYLFNEEFPDGSIYKRYYPEIKKNALENWYWNKSSNGKTICLNLNFSKYSLYETIYSVDELGHQVESYRPKDSLLCSDENFSLSLVSENKDIITDIEKIFDFKYHFAFSFGNATVLSDIIPYKDMMNFNYRVCGSGKSAGTQPTFTKVSRKKKNEKYYILENDNYVEFTGDSFIKGETYYKKDSNESYKISLSINNNVYVGETLSTSSIIPSNGINLFCEYIQNEEDGKVIDYFPTEDISPLKTKEYYYNTYVEKDKDFKWVKFEGESFEDNITYFEKGLFEQKDCFYGTVYDIRLYNLGKTPEEILLLNLGTFRELFSNSPDVYKLADSLYNDVAFVKRVQDDNLTTQMPIVKAIRVFNRSIWDSIMIDPFPISEEEKDPKSPQFVTDFRNPVWDTDIYTQKGSKYYLKDCIEQDLLEDVEVYNGINIIDNKSYRKVKISYNNKIVTLDENNVMSLISTLIEPTDYNEDSLSSKDISFNLKDNIITQDVTSYSYITTPKQQDSSDDFLKYTADIDLNLIMNSEIDLSRWLSRGSNVNLFYDDLMGKPIAKLSDNNICNTSLNNILIPLIIPNQYLTDGEIEDEMSIEGKVGYLDKFYIKDFSLSNSFSVFLNASSYYNEIRIPVAAQKMISEYNEVNNIKYSSNIDKYPLPGRIYYAINMNTIKDNPSSTYTYDSKVTLYTMEIQDDKEVYTVFDGEAFKRDIQYYQYFNGKYRKFCLFKSSSLYFKVNSDGSIELTNEDTLSKYNSYIGADRYNEDSKKIKLFEFKLIEFKPGVTYYERIESYNSFYSFDKTKVIEYYDDYSKEWIEFKDKYFENNIKYRYSDESYSWEFNDNIEYYKKSGDSYSLYLNGAYDITNEYYTLQYVYIPTEDKHTYLGEGKTYYTQTKSGTYLPIGDEKENTRFFILDGFAYFRDLLTTNSYYVYDEEKKKYILISEDDRYKDITTFTDWRKGPNLPLLLKTDTNKTFYYNKWDAIRVLKEGTYYFTCKYPLQILPFSDDVLDSKSELNFTTLYASCRFKVEVKGIEHPCEDKYPINGYPEKYFYSVINNTLKDPSQRLYPEDNMSFPHRDIHIDLYVMDCDGIAGEMIDFGTKENYQFKWTLLGSNYKEAPITLNKKTIEEGIRVNKEVPMFFSKNYTAPFFIAMSEKGSISPNPESADDDLICPIKVNLTHGYGLIVEFNRLSDTDIMYKDNVYYSDDKGTQIPEDLISLIPDEGITVSEFIEKTKVTTHKIEAIYIKDIYDEKITSSSEEDMDELMISSGKTYKILFDYTGNLSEISFTDKIYNTEVVSEIEKANYFKLVNLIDTSTLNKSEYIYNTDGQSFISTGNVQILNHNSGFDTINNGWKDVTTDNNIPEFYFGNPYSKSTNKNYLLRCKNSSSDKYSSLLKISSRQNINNSYTFPYAVKNVDTTHTIPAVIKKLGTVLNQTGYFKELDFNEPDVIKSQYNAIYNGINQAIISSKTEASGCISGFTSVIPHFVTKIKGKSSVEYTFKDTYKVNTNDYDIYGYYASSRSIPMMNDKILIERKNLYSNNLLSNNYFESKSDWIISSSDDKEITVISDYVPDDTWGSGKDVYRIEYINGSSPMQLKYLTGDLSIMAQYEAAINLKTDKEVEVNVVFMYKDKEVSRKKLEITGYSLKDDKVSSFVPNEWLIYSAEIDSEIVSDGVLFEINPKEGQVLYITKVVIRKCNYSKHFLGFSNALDYIQSSTISSKVSLLGHKMILLKNLETNEYVPIQFNNEVVKVQKESGQVIIKPKSGLYRVGEFITNFSLEIPVKQSKIVKLIAPWIRRLHYTKTEDGFDLSFHKYGIKINSLGYKEKQELYSNVSDIFVADKSVIDIIPMEDNTHNYIYIKEIPININENKELSFYNMNLKIDEDNPITLMDEKFSVLFNCFSPHKYREGNSYPVAITNIQLLNNIGTEKYAPSSQKRNILYELEFLPIVYSELNSHVSFNILLYKGTSNSMS